MVGNPCIVWVPYSCLSQGADVEEGGKKSTLWDEGSLPWQRNSCHYRCLDVPLVLSGGLW